MTRQVLKVLDGFYYRNVKEGGSGFPFGRKDVNKLYKFIDTDFIYEYIICRTGRTSFRNQ